MWYERSGALMDTTRELQPRKGAVQVRTPQQGGSQAGSAKATRTGCTSRQATNYCTSVSGDHQPLTDSKVEDSARRQVKPAEHKHNEPAPSPLQEVGGDGGARHAPARIEVNLHKFACREGLRTVDF